MADRTHIQRWAPQDWRTSRVRMRSARTNDPMLRTVYRELLDGLHEHGGTLPNDPEWLSDDLMLPADEIARCLPILAELGKSGDGGIVVEDGKIHNSRVTRELAGELVFRQSQAELGKRGGYAKANARKTRSDRQKKASDGQQVPGGGQEKSGDGLAKSGPPTPAPTPVPTPTPQTSTEHLAADEPPRRSPRQRQRIPVESAGAVAQACEDWAEIMGGTAEGSRIAGAWPALLKLAPWPEIRPVWRWYLVGARGASKGEMANAQSFASRWGYWRDRMTGVLAPPGRAAPGPPGGIIEQNKRVYERMKSAQEAKRGESRSGDGSADADGPGGIGGAGRASLERRGEDAPDTGLPRSA